MWRDGRGVRSHFFFHISSLVNIVNKICLKLMKHLYYYLSVASITSRDFRLTECSTIPEISRDFHEVKCIFFFMTLIRLFLFSIFVNIPIRYLSRPFRQCMKCGSPIGFTKCEKKRSKCSLCK